MFRLSSRPTACSTTLTIAAAALLGVGVVMVFSADASLTGGPGTGKLIEDRSVRQAIFACAALVAMLIVGLCPHEVWRFRRRSWLQPSILLMVLALFLLALVWVPGIGEKHKGAQRWLSLGAIGVDLGFQPSEIAKVALVIFGAAYCSAIGTRIRRFWTGFLPAACLLGSLAAMVGTEDFGTAALLAIVAGCILLGAGAKLRHLFLVSLPAIGGLAYLIAARANRIERLRVFLNPEADPQGSGYQPLQSLLTIASGGWWGKGLGGGIQKYGYLPEGRTDFIFAVICEELGIIGGIAVIALFAVMLWQGKRALEKAPTDFGRLLALGVTMTLGLQTAMNIAVVTVSVPTKGIGLPLVSAGGTGVVFFGLLVGLLVNVARGRHPAPWLECNDAIRCEAVADPPAGADTGMTDGSVCPCA